MKTLGLRTSNDFVYVYGITHEGKTIYWLIGDTSKMDEADAAAAGLIDGEVFELNTRDMHRATQAIKAELLRRGKDPDRALKRMSHTGAQEFIKEQRDAKNPVRRSVYGLHPIRKR